jgi:restriction endonuclease Mrr
MYLIYYGILVTTSKFSSESILFTKHHNIILWDGEKLSHIHYLISIGRFSSINKETFNDSLTNKKETNDLNVKKIYTY